MKKTITAIILALVTVSALALSVYGIAAINKDFEENALVQIENIGPELIREVYAWYYEDGTVEDEQGQLWYFNLAQEEGQMWKLWINDNGTPHNPTDDAVIDYVGG